MKKRLRLNNDEATILGLPIKERIHQSYNNRYYLDDNQINKIKELRNKGVIESCDKLEIDARILDGFKELDKVFHIMCFGENWCPDCVINETIMHKISEVQPLLKMSHFGREGYEELVSSYDPDNKARIPLILIMDEKFNLLGTFNELPKALKEIVASANQVDVIVAKKAYRKGDYANQTAQELLDICFYISFSD